MTGDEGTTMLKSVGQIHVNVHDLDRATRFYQEVLGLRLLFRAGGMSFFDCGGVRLMLSLPERPQYDHAASIIYYKVDDIEAVHAALRDRGVRFHGEPHLIARMPDHEIWMAFCDDSEGNTLALMSEKRQS